MSSIDPLSPPVASGGRGPAGGYLSHHGAAPQHRPSTPPKYKPDNQSHTDTQPASGSDAERAEALLRKVPGATVAYSGLKMLSEHADKAKAWADWLKDLKDTPDEIKSLAAKVTTARDTVLQIQSSIKARPDLFQDPTGRQLQRQIQDTINDTDKTLDDMTQTMSKLSKNGAQEGSAWKGLQDYWTSYKYKIEHQSKVKALDKDLQKHLATLSTLMVNIYS